MNEAAIFRRAAELTEASTPFVFVTLVERIGSAPAEEGAKLIVTSAGLDIGTVGGGRVEAEAIETASRMLAGEHSTQLVDWSLKADVGMTCGGRVKLLFEVGSTCTWPIVIFGAGHVAQAVARLLVTLPCKVTCIDPRADWLGKLPPQVRTIQTDEPAAEVAGLPDDAFVLCMTRGHRSDLPVLVELFRQERVFPYVGVIGSRAKAAVLRKELAEAGIPDERLQFFCPVGLPIGSDAPSEIAVSIAAQLLEQRSVYSDRDKTLS